MENIGDKIESISESDQSAADKSANTKLETLPELPDSSENLNDLSNDKLALPIIGNKLGTDPNSYKQAIKSAKASFQLKAMEKEIARLNG